MTVEYFVPVRSSISFGWISNGSPTIARDAPCAVT